MHQQARQEQGNAVGLRGRGSLRSTGRRGRGLGVVRGGVAAGVGVRDVVAVRAGGRTNNDEINLEEVLRTRRLPNGHSTLYDLSLENRQRLNQLAGQDRSIVCPRCKESRFVQFRYFNNRNHHCSGSLQLRYCCRNPFSCVFVERNNPVTKYRYCEFTFYASSEEPHPARIRADVRRLTAVEAREYMDSHPNLGRMRPR